MDQTFAYDRHMARMQMLKFWEHRYDTLEMILADVLVSCVRSIGLVTVWNEKMDEDDLRLYS